jgi:hypothetical protein
MLRTHQDLLFNWFKAKGEISSGAVEGRSGPHSLDQETQNLS